MVLGPLIFKSFDISGLEPLKIGFQSGRFLAWTGLILAIRPWLKMIPFSTVLGFSEFTISIQFERCAHAPARLPFDKSDEIQRTRHLRLPKISITFAY